jgi:hypothetical protein
VSSREARRRRELLVDLGEQARTGLEQLEPDLLTADTRVESAHVVGEGGQLAEELDAHQAASDDDDRQATAPRARFGRGIGPFELLDQVIPQHERIGHRLEREGVRRAGNQPVVGGCAERDDEMVVR